MRFRSFSQFNGALCYFFLKLAVKLDRQTSFRAPTVSRRNFGKLFFRRFWGVVCKPVYQQSNLKYFQNFSLFDSALWFFLKSSLRVS